MNKNLQKTAYEMLKEIKHNIAKEKFDPEADYLAEFKYPFNTSHGMTIQQVEIHHFLKNKKDKQ